MNFKGQHVLEGENRMIELDNNQKPQVLMHSFLESYNAAHQIRARSMQFVLLISGMAIGLSWLLIYKENK